MITQQMIDAGLAAKVRDYRADDADQHIKTVEQAMHEYGFHHPIDGGEMVRAILEAALPVVAELVEAYRKDAERYRWLRNADNYPNQIGGFWNCLGETSEPEEMDEAIDAAMGASA